MILPGIETLIRKQLNDSFLPILHNTYEQTNKLAKLYYDKRVITSTEFKHDYNTIYKDFSKSIKERFNINMEIKNSKTFAVMPIFNIDDDLEVLSLEAKDIKRTKKQLVEFKSYLEHNKVSIDLVNARINNIPEHFVFTMFINVESFPKLTSREFAAIIIHEIGHIFTLLEMYTNTTKSIVSLSNALLVENGTKINKEDITLASEVSGDKASLTKVYTKLDKAYRNILLADGKHNDHTDVEYEADNFAVQFGLGADLISALNKSIGVKGATYNALLIVTFMVSMIKILIGFILLSLSLSPMNAFSVTLILLVAETMGNISSMLVIHSGRNPTKDEHGDIRTRYLKIKQSIIHMLRTSKLNKKEIKYLLEDIEKIDIEINILEHSFLDGFLGSLLSPVIGSNLNLQDKLGTLLDSLIENNMYVTYNKFIAGIEDKDIIKYHTRLNIGNWNYAVFLTEALKNKTTIKKINTVLSKYNIELTYNKSKSEITTLTPKLCGLYNGISGFAIVPEIDDDSDFSNESVISVTLEVDKVIWQLKNPYIKVYNIDTISINDYKQLYILEIEYLRGYDQKHIRQIDEVAKIIDKIDKELGEEDSITFLNKILESKKISKITLEQLTLLRDYILDEFGNNRQYVYLDLHRGNWGVNNTGDLIVMDPIYNKSMLALKKSNIKKLPLDLLDKRDESYNF